jgi:DNA transformation protein
MPSSSEFVTFALELLSAAGPVEARRMFGGHGLYVHGVMFGLLDDDELFLKTDDACRHAFLEAGCRRWVYEGRGRRMETSYFRPPDEAHDSPEAMLPWAERAIGAALRASEAKAKRERPRVTGARGTSGTRRSPRGRTRS